VISIQAAFFIVGEVSEFIKNFFKAPRIGLLMATTQSATAPRRKS
jgi:hypothetical protein